MMAERLRRQAAASGDGALLVEHWMSRRVTTVKPLDSIRRARALLEERRINQLPVIANGQIVGIVTDRDVRDASPSVFDFTVFGEPAKGRRPPDPAAITVKSVMSPNVLTLAVGASVFEAARVMRQHRIGALPIVDKQRLVGIVTRSDLLNALVAIGERGAGA